MKVSCSNGFAPGDVVRWRRLWLVEDWKIQFTGFFPLFNATVGTLDCKNDLVSSQNAFSTKCSIIIRFFESWQMWWQISSFADPGCLSRILDPGSKFFPSRFPDPGSKLFSSWIPDPGFEFFPSRILDPGCTLKNLSILTKKMVSQLSEIWSEFSIQDPRSGSWFFTYPGSRSWIPDPKSRDQKGTRSLIPDPGSGFATLEISGLLRL